MKMLSSDNQKDFGDIFITAFLWDVRGNLPMLRQALVDIRRPMGHHAGIGEGLKNLLMSKYLLLCSYILG